MAILRAKDARALENAALLDRLEQVKSELNRELGLVRSGGRATNPGRIGEMRRTVARILTIFHERKKEMKKEEKSAKPVQLKKKENEKAAAQSAKKNEVKKVA